MRENIYSPLLAHGDQIQKNNTIHKKALGVCLQLAGGRAKDEV